MEYINPVLETICTRRSVRDFTEQAIEREKLDWILKAGIHAPSGKNMQSWQFTVLTSPQTIQDFKHLIRNTLKRTKTGVLMGYNRPDKVIIVSNRRDNYNAVADGACAIENMLLAASSMGIGGCWINGLRTIYDEPEIRDQLTKFRIPENHLIVGMVVLGYPAVVKEGLKKKDDVIQVVE